jgi:plastocyanin
VNRRQLLTSATTAVAGCTLLVLAGCSSTTSATSTSTGAAGGATSASSASGGTTSTASDTIVIQDFMFHPMTLTVKPDAVITVTNKDTATHTVTSTGSPQAFNSGNVAPGATVTFHAPDKAGTYSYICNIHQYMQGTLTVQ